MRAWKDPAAEITAKEQGDSCENYQDGEGGLAGGSSQGCHRDSGLRVTGSHIQISGRLPCELSHLDKPSLTLQGCWMEQEVVGTNRPAHGSRWSMPALCPRDWRHLKPTGAHVCLGAGAAHAPRHKLAICLGPLEKAGVLRTAT